MLKTFTESKSFFENILDEFSKSDENELLISKDYGSLNLQVARILALL